MSYLEGVGSPINEVAATITDMSTAVSEIEDEALASDIAPSSPSVAESPIRHSSPSPELGEPMSVPNPPVQTEAPPQISSTTALNMWGARIIGFEVNPNSATVQLRVQFPSSSSVRMLPEFDVQQTSEAKLLRFWAQLGGRGEATGLNVYWVFKILKHRKAGDSTYQYLVHWVGYGTRRVDVTWEDEEALRDHAEEYVRAYKRRKRLE